MDTTRRVFCMQTLAILILGGCAPKLLIKDGPMSKGEKPIDIMVRPHQSLGVQVTSAILAGEVTVFEGPLPDEILGEEYPGRIRWDGWAVNESNDKEFFVQIVRIGIYRTGEFMYAFMVDGKKSELEAGTKVLELSSVGEYVSNLAGDTYRMDRNKFISEKAYRRELVRQLGSPIGARKEIAGFLETVKSWNRYQIKEGEIYCPYGEADLKRIARINPSYGLGEKIIAKGHMTISTSPVATVASIALAVIEGMRAPTEGWDYTSQLPNRETMAAIISYVGTFRLALIKQLNEESAQLRAENTKGEVRK